MFTACFLDAFPDARVFAVESDARMKIDSRSIAVRSSSPNLSRLPNRAMRNPKADLIILTDVLEHAVEPEALLSLIARALKPGGFAYITLPNADSYGTFPYHVPASEIEWNLANWTHQHLWMMNPRVLNDIINRTFVLREMSRTFETGIRRDGDYSTFLVQRGALTSLPRMHQNLPFSRMPRALPEVGF